MEMGAGGEGPPATVLPAAISRPAPQGRRRHGTRREATLLSARPEATPVRLGILPSTPFPPVNEQTAGLCKVRITRPPRQDL